MWDVARPHVTPTNGFARRNKHSTSNAINAVRQSLWYFYGSTVAALPSSPTHLNLCRYSSYLSKNCNNRLPSTLRPNAARVRGALQRRRHLRLLRLGRHERALLEGQGLRAAGRAAAGREAQAGVQRGAAGAIQAHAGGAALWCDMAYTACTKQGLFVRAWLCVCTWTCECLGCIKQLRAHAMIPPFPLLVPHAGQAHRAPPPPAGRHLQGVCAGVCARAVVGRNTCSSPCNQASLRRIALAETRGESCQRHHWIAPSIILQAPGIARATIRNRQHRHTPAPHTPALRHTPSPQPLPPVRPEGTPRAPHSTARGCFARASPARAADGPVYRATTRPHETSHTAPPHKSRPRPRAPIPHTETAGKHAMLPFYVCTCLPLPLYTNCTPCRPDRQDPPHHHGQRLLNTPVAN